ncbi:TetR family transcriptional regulator [Nocardia otitidiscaviarum]|uniref:TetR/AcrR family transcriptional regulator n=1 Tax=Nocardia otitidiscaviarum TaxID=1823 RepID=UPI0004A77DAA|nr:TetR family transcriptional regulator [Nocardia otitidiscaviarum]MBF6137463.1 TetR family transcriptional regulator [Nocardia otitidiscaviarum]MBF6488275.1 TetR family transcriptional regulator [Nocardia otitidiscaviarum]
MGNREDLLNGAKQAILERGLAKVTARDIAAAAGVSLAAIGYHFGSKDQLVTEALLTAMGGGVGDDFEQAIREAGEGRPLSAALAPTWTALLEVVRRNREILLLSLENGVRVARDPDQQRVTSEAVANACDELAATLRDQHPDLDAAAARAVARFYFVQFQGLALLSLIAPTAAVCEGGEFARAVAVLARS